MVRDVVKLEPNGNGRDLLKLEQVEMVEIC